MDYRICSKCKNMILHDELEREQQFYHVITWDCSLGKRKDPIGAFSIYSGVSLWTGETYGDKCRKADKLRPNKNFNLPTECPYVLEHLMFA